MPVARCPECGTGIEFQAPPLLGEGVSCPGCRARLEVTSSTPLELDWSFEAPIGDPNRGERTKPKVGRSG